MNLAQPTPRQLTGFLFVAVVLSLFAFIANAPLFDVDEGAFSEATREMFDRQDFISPYLDGAPRFDKPILIHWLQAASVAVFGVNEFAFRLPSALAATLWVWLVFRFGAQFLDRTTGLIAAAITATALGVTLIGKAATADALLNALLAASMFDIYRYYHTRDKATLYRVFVWMGLGFLAKGPVAVLIPLVVSFAFFAWQREWRLWLKTAFNPFGLVIFCAIALPWYVVQYLREGDAFIQGFFFKHNIGRFQSPMEGHGGGIFYYALIALLLVFPYTSLFVRTLARARDAAREPLARYLWLWFGFVIVFFSLSGTKLPHYLLYGMTPVFLLMAQHRALLKSRLAALLPVAALFLLLLFLPELLGRFAAGAKDPYVQALLPEVPRVFDAGYRVIVGGALALVVALLFVRVPAWVTLLASGLAGVSVIAAALGPAVADLKQEPIRAAGRLVQQNNYAPVVALTNTPSFSVYAQRASERRQPRAGDVVLVFSHKRPALPHEVLYESRGLSLVRIPETAHAN